MPGLVQKLITPESFLEMTKYEMEEYIRDRFDIENNYLIGKVVPHKGSCRIEELRNPTTGLLLGAYIKNSKHLKRADILNIKSQNRILHKDVLFNFRIHEDIKIDTVQLGEILFVEEEEIIVLNDIKDIFEYVNLNIPGIVFDNSNDNKMYFLTDFYQSILKKQLNDKVQSIQEEKKNIDEENNKIKKHRLKLFQYSEGLQKKERSLNEKENNISQIEKEVKDNIEQLKELGFNLTNPVDNCSTEQKESSINYETEIEIITHIKNQSFSHPKRWVYEEATIRCFYTALKTNELIILSGPSGTGKSSLVSVFANIIGAQKRIIPVQPSWTDKQDLLGFYNPMKKEYVSSPLLDVIVEAKENKEKYKENADLFIICLDELNLSQVEYYLADILSVREQENEGIHLYSSYEYKQAMEEIEWFVQKELSLSEVDLKEWNIKNNIGSMKELEYRQRYKNLKRFPPIIQIPDNIRFIGTINVDGTTKSLSPKVVDRSFIIPLNKQKKDNHELQDFELNLTLKANNFTVETVEDEYDILKQFNKHINKLNDCLNGLNANYNDRVKNQIKKYLAANVNFKGINQILIDEVFVTKIIPRIDYLITNEPDGKDYPNQLIKYVSDNLGEQSKSYKILNNMFEKSKNTRMFSYWSN